MNAKRQDPRSAQDVADDAAAKRSVDLDQQQHHELAEATVLAAFLRASPSLPDDLDPNIFYREAHRLVADLAILLRESGRETDEITMVDELTERGQLDAAGGPYYVSRLYEARPMSTETQGALAIVLRNFYRRRVDETRYKLVNAFARGDYAEGEHHLAEIKYWEEMQAGAAQAIRPAPIRFVGAIEAMNTPPARGIVGDLLYEDSIAEIYAPSGTWKSFIAIGMGLHIVTARPWLGRLVKAGHVVYVAAEAGRGVGKRMRAWCRQHGVAEEEIEGRFHLVTLPVKLTQMERIVDLITSIKAQCGEAPVLVVFDTLARSVDGSTNDDEVMNAVLDSATAIRSEFCCCVLIVHHTGKDTTRGSKGNNALPNGVDTIISVKSRKDTEPSLVLQPGDVVTLTCEKPKDEEPFEPIAITAERVCWTIDDGTEYGRTVSSLVMVCADAARAAQPTRPTRLPTSCMTALAALSSATSGYRTNEWWHASGLKRSTFFSEARKELLARELVCEVESAWRLTAAGEALLGGREGGRIVPFRPA